MAFEVINDSVGPDGLVLTLFVYGALPRFGLPHYKPSTSTFQRAAALCRATDKMTRRYDRRPVQSVLGPLNGPDVFDNHTMPICSHALVYSPKTER